jgi:hypothetical protein
MTKGIVYILTNPSLDGWIKIGMTENDDITTRLDSLNSSASIPLTFRVYATYDVTQPQKVEKDIHSLFDLINMSLHARETLSSGRIREREFFRIKPETAFEVFKTVASLRGDRDQLKLISPDAVQAEEEQIAEQAVRRPNFKFSMLQIQPGSELKFLYDDSCVCQTADENNKVMYKDEKHTLSSLAQKLLVEKQGWQERPVQGPKFFTYQGTPLTELRDMLDHGDEED